MTTSTDPVWVTCQEDDCQAGIGVHWRHVESFLGRFYCPTHTGTTTEPGAST